jgi:pSer/pThr/pTyr-binding forkhead associated (FHA) protein
VNDSLPSLFLGASGLAGPLQLQIAGPDGQVVATPRLEQPFALIGRDPNADVVLDHPLVSRRHTFLQVVQGRVFCVDLLSRTGTLRDGQSEKSGWLPPGEGIGVGPYTIGVDVEPRTDLPPVPDPAIGEWDPLSPRGGAPVSLPELAIEFLNGQTRHPLWPVRATLILMGRLPGCQVRLVEPSVSRFHCCLLRTPQGIWVVDLLGRQGVRVNGNRIRQARLEDGDQLQIGRFLLRLHCHAPSPPATPTLLASDAAMTVAMNGQPTADDMPEPPPSPDAGEGAVLTMPSLFPARGMLPAAAGDAAGKGVLQETVLLPLLNQFNQMQQQMFDQFHQSVLLVVQTFSALHRDQMGVIREELDRLHQLTSELHTLQAELAKHPRADEPAAQAASASPSGPALDAVAAELLERMKLLMGKPLAAENGQPPAPRPAPPPAPTASPPRPSEPKAPPRPVVPPPAPAASASPAAAHGPSTAATNEEIHAWLSDRIASIQQEQESRWQKILQFMLGK